MKKYSLIILFISLFSSLTYADDQIDIGKLKQSRQNNSNSNAVFSDRFVVTYDERRRAYEDVKDVEHHSILGGYAADVAKDIAKGMQEHNFITVDSNCTSGLFDTCLVKNLILKGPQRVFISNNNSPTTGISPMKSDADYVGKYSFILVLDIGNKQTKTCSGSFKLNGKKRHIHINVYKDSCEGSVSFS